MAAGPCMHASRNVTPLANSKRPGRFARLLRSRRNRSMPKNRTCESRPASPNPRATLTCFAWSNTTWRDVARDAGDADVVYDSGVRPISRHDQKT